MKKIIKVFSLILVCLLMSSCVKYHANMIINNDGSVEFNFISAIKKEYADQYNQSQDYSELKEEGFLIDEYTDKEYKGYKISKHYATIDSISSEDIKTSTLTKNDDKFFNVKKGFFKNTYTAKLESKDTEEMKDNVSMYQDDSSTQELNELLKSFDLKFNLNLPTKVVSSNATTTSSDGKNLQWDLTNMKDQYIEFTFVLYNTNNILLACGLALIILAILIVVIRYLMGTKHRLYMVKEKVKNKK